MACSLPFVFAFDEWPFMVTSSRSVRDAEAVAESPLRDVSSSMRLSRDSRDGRFSGAFSLPASLFRCILGDLEGTFKSDLGVIGVFFVA